MSNRTWGVYRVTPNLAEDAKPPTKEPMQLEVLPEDCGGISYLGTWRETPITRAFMRRYRAFACRADVNDRTGAHILCVYGPDGASAEYSLSWEAQFQMRKWENLEGEYSHPSFMPGSYELNYIPGTGRNGKALHVAAQSPEEAVVVAHGWASNVGLKADLLQEFESKQAAEACLAEIEAGRL